MSSENKVRPRLLLGGPSVSLIVIPNLGTFASGSNHANSDALEDLHSQVGMARWLANSVRCTLRGSCLVFERSRPRVTADSYGLIEVYCPSFPHTSSAEVSPTVLI